MRNPHVCLRAWGFGHATRLEEGDCVGQPFVVARACSSAWAWTWTISVCTHCCTLWFALCLLCVGACRYSVVRYLLLIPPVYHDNSMRARLLEITISAKRSFSQRNARSLCSLRREKRSYKFKASLSTAVRPSLERAYSMPSSTSCRITSSLTANV